MLDPRIYSRAMRAAASVVRGSRRHATSAAAGVALIAGAQVGCGDTEPGPAEGTSAADAAQETDVVSSSDVAATTQDTTTQDVADVVADPGALPDDAAVGIEILGDVPVFDAPPSAYGWTPIADTCLHPTGVACVDFNECDPSDVCHEGECAQQDFNNPNALECCQEQYAQGNFGVPGCNPWGPPAPPAAIRSVAQLTAMLRAATAEA